MTDEGLHEIQLNGKQLVFLFMAATVVAVVIFLCGVMVGRGVRGPQGGELTTAALDSTGDPTAPAQSPTSTGSAPDGAPLSSQETLTYAERLEAPDPPVETLVDAPASAVDPTRPTGSERAPAPTQASARTAPAPPVAAPTRPTANVAAPAAARPPASIVTPAPPAARAAAPASSTISAGTRPAVMTPASPPEPAGTGFVVQVAAVTDRGEADTIARRLGTKGYPAFVTTPAGAARVFRVRVGKFKERREAETVAARLEKEEQFKPWITR